MAHGRHGIDKGEVVGIDRSTVLALVALLAIMLWLKRDPIAPSPYHEAGTYVPHTEEWPLGGKAVLTVYDDAKGNRLGSMMVREEPQVIRNKDGTWEVILR